MSARYQAAIIGCGDIGHAHAEGYRLNPQVDLVAVVDPVERARHQFQEEYGVPEAYASVEELFAVRTPDLVSVCVWHLLHPEVTIAAAEAGARAVICEKPMAIGMAAVDSMIDACDRAGTKLLVSHQRRYTPGWECARDLIADGAIGEISLAQGRCGAGLLNVGTHLVDGIRFVLGDPPAEWVFAALERDTERYERDTPIEDACMVLATFEGGPQLLVQSDLHQRRTGRVRGIRLLFEGSDGMIEASEGMTRLFNADSGGWRDVVHLERVDAIGGQANGRQVADLLAWLEGGPEPRTSARSGRQTTEILMAAYESARRHRVVRLPLAEMDYPLGLMLAEGSLVPGQPGAYDIRAFLRREVVDEKRYAELRAQGLRHHHIMAQLEAERMPEHHPSEPEERNA